MKFRFVCAVIGLLSLVSLTVAQTSAPDTSSLPRLVRFGGTVKDLNGNPLTGVVGLTFALYSEKTGGAPLWLETQNANADRGGHYMVLLGSTKPEGLPAELFTSKQARWVGVQVSGQAEHQRVLLVSAPYAFKAGDAETLGGLPLSAFVLATPAVSGAPAPAQSSPARSTAPVNPSVTGVGTVGTLPLWDLSSDITSSAITQTGSGSAAHIGIDTPTPTSTLDVKGAGTFRGALGVTSSGTATTAAGKPSFPMMFTATAFNSGTATSVTQTFRWQAEPVGNDTASASGRLSLLFSSGTNTATETGLSIASNGQMTFAAGQTFPGAGTLTGITTAAGSGLSGGGTTGTLSLKVPPAGITNAMLADSKITLNNNTAGGLTTPGTMALGSTYTIGLKACATSQILQYSGTAWDCVAPTGTGTINGVTAGTDLTGGGTSGKVTLNLDTTKVPQLAANNTFSGNNTFDAATIFQTIQADGQTTVGLPTSGTFPTLTAQLTVFSSGPTGWDGIDTTGGDDVGSGISATGGDEIESSSIQGGTGGSFIGGYSPGTTGDGIDAAPGDASFSAGAGWAGLFVGDIDVTGVVFGAVKDFKVDHPLDPANKYLVHASVESSEMMNIYSGNVVTDELGLARVKLPDWFEAENTDFRYQLTVIGGRFAQAIVSKEIADHQFTISTNATNVKVSWQVTAVRKDAFAKAHPLVVEQQKPAHERGFYQNPELFGQPAEKQTEWGRHPQQMQHMKTMREQQKLQSQQHAAPQRPAASVVQSPAPEVQLKPLTQVESK